MCENTKNTDNNVKKRPFQYNSPVLDEKHYKTYGQVLNDAINKEDVFNVGIIAPYGSGKSSLIKTFLHSHPEIEKQTNYITLASFKKDKKMEDRQMFNVEKSILEQIIFKRKHHYFSKSRIDRIKGGIWSTLLMAFSLVCFVALVVLAIMSYLKTIPIFKSDAFFYFYFYSSIVAGILSFVLVFREIKISKITFKNVELEFESNKNGSVLNRFIDEVINYCIETKTKYFVFEDIDRFNSVDLLLKIREINTLINENEGIKAKGKVAFIYCVSDKVFEQYQDRAKFFDFIISPTPLLNPENARKYIFDVLNKKDENNIFDNEDLHLKEAAMKEMSYFIKEKRVLNNIVNDYIVYKDNLKIPDEQNEKLFAMMVYKNLYFRDFAKLQSNNGFLYDFFNKYKNEAYKNATSAIQNKINDLRRKKEAFYVEDYPSEFQKLKQKVSQIILSDDSLAIDSHDANYQNNLTISDYSSNCPGYYLPIDTYIGVRTRTFYKSSTIDKIKAGLDGKTPKEAQEQIINSTHDHYTRVIEEKETELRKIRRLSANELLSEGYYSAEVSGNLNNRDFLLFAIKNNYIDESYFVYSGRADTEMDNDYIKSVLNGEKLEFERPVQNPALVISRLSINRFSSPGVLNDSVVDALLDEEQKDIFSNKLSTFMDYIIKEKNETIDFVCHYLGFGRNAFLLIEEFYKKGYCDVIYDVAQHDGYNSTSIYTLFKYIVFADQNREKYIPFFNQNRGVASIIENCDHPIEAFLLHFLKLQDCLSFLHQIGLNKIKHLDDIRNIPHGDIRSIFKQLIYKRYFEINFYNLTLIYTLFARNKSFSVSTFITLNSRSISSYFLENLPSLVEVISSEYKKLDESDETIKAILNNDDISIETKRVFFAKLVNTIDYIDGLSLEKYELLLSTNVLNPSFSSLSKILKAVPLNIDVLAGFVKNHIRLFGDRIDDISLFVTIMNNDSFEDKFAWRLCDYLDVDVDINLIKDDLKRSVFIRSGKATVDTQSFVACLGMKKSIVACLSTNDNLIDSLGSIVKSTNEIMEIINDDGSSRTVKKKVAFKYYATISNYISDSDVETILDVVSDIGADDKYDADFLTGLLKRSSRNDKNSIILSIAEKCLSDKEAVKFVKNNDIALYKLLVSTKEKITMLLSIKNKNDYYKMLENKRIIKTSNVRIKQCNVNVKRFNSLI